MGGCHAHLDEKATLLEKWVWLLPGHGYFHFQFRFQLPFWGNNFVLEGATPLLLKKIHFQSNGRGHFLKCSHSLRSSLILVTTYQGFPMRYYLHMFSTLKDEKILKIVRNLGLKTCLCRSICPPVYFSNKFLKVFCFKQNITKKIMPT